MANFILDFLSMTDRNMDLLGATEIISAVLVIAICVLCRTRLKKVKECLVLLGIVILVTIAKGVIFHQLIGMYLMQFIGIVICYSVMLFVFKQLEKRVLMAEGIMIITFRALNLVVASLPVLHFFSENGSKGLIMILLVVSQLMSILITLVLVITCIVILVTYGILSVKK